ncbi:methyltransferase domain-containing protein [Pseudoxanthomonas mexicana]
MENDLTLLPFDHYQRYATAARLLSLIDGNPSILEVGANRQRLLGEFLPGSRILYSDIEAQPEATNFIVADASRLPLADSSFDAVVSLDVLEHIPVSMRLPAVREMCRVARTMVVIGCPTDEPHVLEAEAAANAYWNKHFPDAYPWLAEHEEFGLVDAESVSEVLRQSGLIAVNLGHGDPQLWASLMGAHFLKEAYAELLPLSCEIDALYNRVLFASDRPIQSYRRFFVGVRTHQQAYQLREMLAPSAVEPALLEFLKNLPESLQPLLQRLVHAESEWKASASLAESLQEDLRTERLAHHQTGLKLQAEAESAIVRIRSAEQGWKESADLARRLEAELIRERASMAEMMRRLHDVQATCEELEERHGRDRARIATLESELCAEQDISDAARGELVRWQEQIHDLANAMEELPDRGSSAPASPEPALVTDVERILAVLQRHRTLQGRADRLRGALIAAAALVIGVCLVLIITQMT